MKNALPYYHATIGDVDIKTKMVAAGCPGEAVAIHCSRSGHHLPWNAETELQAREILSWIKEKFAGRDYKLIPVPAPYGLGLKVHPMHTSYPGGVRCGEAIKDLADDSPSTHTTDIFNTIREVIEAHSGSETNKIFRCHANDSHENDRLMEHALRREIARIIRSGGHLDTKVNDIVRLMGVA